MDLAPDECWRRLDDARHGVLATVHASRGVDAVPVVFAIADGKLVVPIDTVKAKTTTKLQRLENLRADPRCVLLVEHHDDDWSQLWWVRVHGLGVESSATPEVVGLLAARYEQYRSAGAIASVIAIAPERVTGWANRLS